MGTTTGAGRSRAERMELGSSLGWSFVGLTVALVVLTTAVGTRWSPLVSLDRGVADRAYAATYGHQVAIGVWLAVTNAGQPMVMRAVLVLIAVGMAVRRDYRRAVLILAVTVVEAVAAPAAKLVLQRPRPSWPEPITTVPSSSYPSGHAAAAATLATVVLLTALGAGHRRWHGQRVAGLVVAAATLVAASRVFLGVHYLSDIVGGVLLGAALTAGCWWLSTALRFPAARRT